MNLIQKISHKTMLIVATSIVASMSASIFKPSLEKQRLTGAMVVNQIQLNGASSAPILQRANLVGNSPLSILLVQ